MTRNTTSTRRAFLKGGALLAAPLGAASASVLAVADGPLRDRVSRLEDEAAIRTLHHSWLRTLNGGGRESRLDASVRRITSDPAAPPDRIDLAADHRSAVGYFNCAVEFATPLANDSTLAPMAHAQGHGVTRRTEFRALTVNYAKANGGWHIAHVALATV
jgi:hypothetical protein